MSNIGVYKSCRHCGERKSIFARGICRRCYMQPKVRHRYPKMPPRPPEDVEPCLHCGANKGTRPRGLCCACHEKLEVRELYPPRCKLGQAFDSKWFPAPPPTGELPGTPGKIAELATRVALRQRLWSSRDARYDLG